MENKPILVTGATGYIGGRLVPQLIKDGHRVRAAARSLKKLKGRPWANHPDCELAQADFLNPSETLELVAGCSAAYYLVHSMNPEQRDFADADRKAASNFIKAADQCRIERIIYLGGLGWDQPNSSSHLKSRHEVGNILQSGHTPVTRFRAAQILGSGSASFEMMRYLLERLPLFMIPDFFIDTKIQPISIRNVLVYLTACLDKPQTLNESFDIGGPDILTYRELLEIYAEEMGTKKPVFIDTPSFTLGRKIGLSLIRWILPLPDSISKPLLEGLTVQVTLKDYRIREIIPQELISCRETIARAIQVDSLQLVQSRWTDAGELKPPEWLYTGDAPYSGGMVLSCGCQMDVMGRIEAIWSTILGIGGKDGWYYGHFIRRFRDFINHFLGGTSSGRGRRHSSELWVGDVVDSWRVLDIKTARHLVLRSEKKQPGESILVFELLPAPSQSTIRISLWFCPKRLRGLIYWYLFTPFRWVLYRGMIRNIARFANCQMISRPRIFKPQQIV